MRTAWKRQSRRERSSRKKCLSSSSMVKTQWRWWQRRSLKDMEVERSWQYLTPQVGQKRLLHRKGTNFIFPHWEQAYMAPPKEGSPQFIIFSMFSISTARGWSVYWMTS